MTKPSGEIKSAGRKRRQMLAQPTVVEHFATIANNQPQSVLQTEAWPDETKARAGFCTR
jgi:hypothetical protein